MLASPSFQPLDISESLFTFAKLKYEHRIVPVSAQNLRGIIGKHACRLPAKYADLVTSLRMCRPIVTTRQSDGVYHSSVMDLGRITKHFPNIMDLELRDEDDSELSYRIQIPALRLRSFRLMCARKVSYVDVRGVAKTLRRLILKSCHQMSRLIISNTDDSGDFPLKQITMSECAIKKLPENIGSHCSNLQILILSRCTKLETLPESIGDCADLSHVDVSGCQSLRALPERICECKRLSTLDVSDTLVTEMPQRLGDCAKLQTLRAVCVPMVTLPASIGECAELRKLLFACSRQTGEMKTAVVPETIRLCKKLKVVVFHDFVTAQPQLLENFGDCVEMEELVVDGIEGLHKLPTCIAAFVKIRAITINDISTFTTIPSEIGDCVELIRLYVTLCGRVVELPERLGDCKRLQVLQLRALPSLKKLPDRIVECTSLRTIDMTDCTNLQSLPRELVERIGVAVRGVAKRSYAHAILADA